MQKSAVAKFLPSTVLNKFSSSCSSFSFKSTCTHSEIFTIENFSSGFSLLTITLRVLQCPRIWVSESTECEMNSLFAVENYLNYLKLFCQWHWSILHNSFCASNFLRFYCYVYFGNFAPLNSCILLHFVLWTINFIIHIRYVYAFFLIQEQLIKSVPLYSLEMVDGGRMSRVEVDFTLFNLFSLWRKIPFNFTSFSEMLNDFYGIFSGRMKND